MEAVRPRVDAYLWDWISRSPLKRAWFFEEGDGRCRLMAEITKQLTFTTDTWSREIAPVAEWFVKELCSHMLDMSKLRRPGTRLTQERRRVAVGSVLPDMPAVHPQQKLCKNCGALISAKSQSCITCARKAALARMPKMREAGRSAEALKKRSESASRSHGQQLNWLPSEHPS
jgi:hypothetical protein